MSYLKTSLTPKLKRDLFWNKLKYTKTTSTMTPTIYIEDTPQARHLLEKVHFKSYEVMTELPNI